MQHVSADLVHILHQVHLKLRKTSHTFRSQIHLGVQRNKKGKSGMHISHSLFTASTCDTYGDDLLKNLTFSIAMIHFRIFQTL